MSEQIDDVVDVEADEVVDGVVDEEVDDSTAGDDGGDDDTLGAPSLAAAIEALLLLADEPMSVMDLAAATRQPADEVEAVVRALSEEYTEQMRGFDLREVAGGWRYYSRTECSP
ncbi:MAG: segregation and condensation protein, partial [Actinomycetota bacterium]|nr:segregation and condensation protein [Actinomycetota bacterium]